MRIADIAEVITMYMLQSKSFPVFKTIKLHVCGFPLCKTCLVETYFIVQNYKWIRYKFFNLERILQKNWDKIKNSPSQLEKIAIFP